MTTKIVSIDPDSPAEDLIRQAAQILKKGGLVIIPTETVYGIAADSSNEKAITRLSEIKGRSADKPFSLHIAEKEKIEEFAGDIPVNAYKLIDKFWPGPLTLVLKTKDSIRSAKGEPGKGTIGIRMPDNEVALQIISLSGVNVVCPSANLFGKPAPASLQEAIKDLNGKVDFAIDAGKTRLGLESSVVDITGEHPVILREGAIKKEEIEAVTNKKIVLFVCTGNSCRSVMAKAYMEKRLKEKDRRDVIILSAGILGLNNMGPTAETRQVLQKEGIDVNNHRSSKVNAEMVKKSDIILVMERIHEERILELAPQAKTRVFLLKEFAKIEGDGSTSIADPIGNSLEFYERTFKIIKEAVNRAVEII